MTKKLTKKELTQFSELVNQEQRLLAELGQITLTEINLEERKVAAINFKKSIAETREELITTLREKYGEGEISLEKGTFTPSVVEEQPQAEELPTLKEAPADVEPAKGLVKADKK